jgi:hypothetical protein
MPKHPRLIEYGYYFGYYIVGHIVGVSHGHADLVLPKSGIMEFGDSLVGVLTIFKHADYGGSLLSFHEMSLRANAKPQIVRKAHKCHVFRSPSERMEHFGFIVFGA